MRHTEYGSEYDFQANQDFISSENTGFVKEDWQLYRSGRDAMKAFARLAGRKKVLLPALCCESMILPFKLNGYKVEFYRLNEDLSCSETDVLQKLEDGCVLLYMRYFGIPAFSDAFLEGVRAMERDILIVEDRTQDIIIERRAEGFMPDATLASLRKWAALPDGGMLTTKLGSGDGEEDSRFARIRRDAMMKKSRYLETWEPGLKQEFLSELNAAAQLLDESGLPVKMGGEEEQLLRSIRFEKLAKRRVDNTLLLKQLISPLAQAGKLRFVTDSPELSTLYLPIFLEDRGSVQGAMAKNDIYCPVIWPQAPGTEGVCPVAEYVIEHMLAIPCDQRYTAEDIHFIADSLTTILTEK